MSQNKLFAIVALAALLVGCSSSPSIDDPEPVDTVYDDGASTAGAGADLMGDGEDITGRNDELQMIIYFAFDSAEVRPQDQDLVASHALQLSQNSNYRVRLEGHTDERGSREYNIGLGERRSQAVRQILMIQGVRASQVSTVSFGEERPAAFGSSESDYAQNRRVEIAYTN